ncbi:histidine kinase [Snodgrassella sp. CFCC 13594]|uniref:histidine kinase n=1 Tax=Snodgrassella sp. CFCC 13594 TaxID=1775559 RepID=UPI000832FF12|nr:histidine kinase [Snodgrassella sp. CFCC 13594]
MKRIWQQIDRSFLRGQRLSRVLMVFIAIWLLLATGLIGLSLNTSWRLEERGMAINEAGSLRKRVFHMMLLAEQPHDQSQLLNEYHEFEKILRHLKMLREGGFGGSARHQALQKQVTTIDQHFQAFWHQTLAYSQNKIGSQVFLAEAESFTEAISDLVLIIEQDNTRNIELLRWFQLSLLIMAFISALASFRLLHYLVIAPLYRLNEGIVRIRQGHFHARVDMSQANEFGQVAHGFNLMAEKLSVVYDNLENLVSEKTQALRKKNHELAVLYDMTSVFQEHQELSILVQTFIHKMMVFSGAEGCAVQLKKRHSSVFEVVGTSGLPELVVNDIRQYKCAQGHCQQVICAEYADIASPVAILPQNYCGIQQAFPHCLAFSIRSADDEIGILNLYAHHPLHVSAEDQQLVSTVCSQFGIAIESLRLNELDKQMAILEERNLMAQGLHDSIAQSLSFLNMQVQVLEKALVEQQTERITQTLHFIDEGIQECYDDVRELLSNFRVRLAREGFLSSLQSVMSRFEKQTGITLAWTVTGEAYELDADEQLQMVFIVQEALSNIRKHAHANHVQLHLVYAPDGVELTIQDNGVGFDTQELRQKEVQGHVGTSIMKERAGKIDGQLKIVSKTDQAR